MGRKKSAAPPDPWETVPPPTDPPPTPEGADPVTDPNLTAASGEEVTGPPLSPDELQSVRAIEEGFEKELVPPALALAKHRKTKKQLRHYFTTAEKLEIADDFSQAQITLAGLAEELKTIKTNFMSDMTIQQETINKLSRAYHAGYEMRSVECTEYRDYDNKKVLTIRDDTGEIVHERSMTLDESQHFIDFEDPRGEVVDAELHSATQGKGGEEPPGPGEGEGDQSPPPPAPAGEGPGEAHP